MTECSRLHPPLLSLSFNQLALWMSAARLLDDDTTRHRWLSGILHRHFVNLHSATDQSSNVFDQVDIVYKLMLRILLNSTIICMTVISYLSTENLTFVEFKIASTIKPPFLTRFNNTGTISSALHSPSKSLRLIYPCPPKHVIMPRP